jgi:uncharacterized protein (DUF2235 family)
MKRLVLCLDGTWNSPNNAKQRDDLTTVYKPSNPLKVARSIPPVAPDGLTQVTYYDSGVGALNRHPGLSNKALQWLDNKLGGAWGAGFQGNVEDAYTFIVNNYGNDDLDQIYVFGFSRGAGQARSLCRLISWAGGIVRKSDSYYAPDIFRAYLEVQGAGTLQNASERIQDPALRAKLERALPKLSAFGPPRVRFLGVWDTVLALGPRLRSGHRTSTPEQAFHTGSRPAACVDVACQALAIDESRYDFRPEIWREPHDGQSLKQRWFAGAHSNVGGGLRHDGLANISLHWIVEEARAANLHLDEGFLKHYRPYPEDELHDSRNLFYKFRELPLTLTRLRRPGSRELSPAGYQRAGIDIDESALRRLRTAASPEESRRHERLGSYEPANLIEYLAGRPEYDNAIPASILARINKLRRT